MINNIVNYKSAVFSPYRNYRYVLWRRWDREKPYALFIGLNPSTADEKNDDPTIRRCIGFASDWGYGGLCIMNLFALRATDPKEMMKHPRPIGYQNDGWLFRLSRRAGIIIAAWGTNGAYQHRDKAVCALLGDLYCLGITKAGHPKHPLYIRKDKALELFWQGEKTER